MTGRRLFIAGLLGTAITWRAGSAPRVNVASAVFPIGRPKTPSRRFRSAVVERELARVLGFIRDPELGWLFQNCYPNTLDTTVFMGGSGAAPDAFVITGDIDAMWLRDSSAQVRPYVHLVARDPSLRRLFRGLIARQARSILLDPYANAFMRDPTARTTHEWALNDRTDMRPGVAERKWELDSLCYPMRLASSYWRATKDRTPFDRTWHAAMRVAVATMREQQRKAGPGPYRFERSSERPSESLMLGGYGNPSAKVGLIHSMFRPSDDACLYPFLIPSNLFAATVLPELAEIVRATGGDGALAAEAEALAAEVSAALARHGRMRNAAGDEIWAYEVDGFGNAVFMDDANAPSLSSLAYLGCCALSDPLYRRTRAAAWSGRNPYFFQGAAAEGIGGPHVGLGQIWPMSIVMRGLTAEDDEEVLACLRALKRTHAGTGFMHESFDKDDPVKFTRPWFAWANGLFGELIIHLAQTRPAILGRALS